MRPLASCLEPPPVVVCVSSLLVLRCPGVHWLPPTLEVERVLLLINAAAVVLTINLFVCPAQSNLSLVVSTCTALHKPPIKWFAVVLFTRV